MRYFLFYFNSSIDQLLIDFSTSTQVNFQILLFTPLEIILQIYMPICYAKSLRCIMIQKTLQNSDENLTNKLHFSFLLQY